MYISFTRDDEGVKFILLDDDKEVFYTSVAFNSIDDCENVIDKIKDNSTFVKYLPWYFQGLQPLIFLFLLW